MAAFNDENIVYNRELNSITEWWTRPRFRHVYRPYEASSIVAKRSRISPELPSLHQSKCLWDLLRRHHRSRTFTLTYAPVDSLQGLEMSPYLETVYASGELTSASISGISSNSSIEVEKLVHEIFGGQMYQDKLQRETRYHLSSQQRNGDPIKDFLSPIIAKVGFGQSGSTLLNHCQTLIKNGAAGILIEDRSSDDQVHVLMPTSEHIRQLTSLRSLCDTIGAETVIISRITAEKALFITSNIDKRDHPYIIGATNPSIRPLVTILEEASKEGKRGIELHAIREKWIDEAGLCTYGDVVANHLRSSHCHSTEHNLNRWLSQYPHISYYEARELARSLNVNTFWDCEIPRTEEGYYRVTGGINMAIARAHAFLRQTDCLSLQTSQPCLKEAQKFSNDILCQHPYALLAYSLSHDWTNVSEHHAKSFSFELGKLGFVWQCIENAGAHNVALASESFSRDIAQRNLLAYTKSILPHLNGKIRSISEDSDRPYASHVTPTESMIEDRYRQPYHPKFHHIISGHISPFQKSCRFYSGSQRSSPTLNLSPLQSELPQFNFDPQPCHPYTGNYQPGPINPPKDSDENSKPSQLPKDEKYPRST